MEFTSSSEKQKSPQENGPVSYERGKVTFLRLKLVGKVCSQKLYVSVCTHGIASALGEVMCFEFSGRTVEVFICEPCDLNRRSSAKELNMDVTEWQLFLEANYKHYQELEILSWQKEQFIWPVTIPTGNRSCHVIK